MVFLIDDVSLDSGEGMALTSALKALMTRGMP